MRRWKPVTVEIISFLLIVLFAYTAVSKLSTPVSFQHSLSQSPLLAAYAHILAWLIPAIEIAVSLALAIPVLRKAGLAASCLLMLSFTIYIGWMLASQTKLPCSCGGVINLMSWKAHFFFNVAMTLLALTGWILIRNRTQSPSSPQQKNLVPLYSNKPPAGGRQGKPKT